MDDFVQVEEFVYTCIFLMSSHCSWSREEELKNSWHKFYDLCATWKLVTCIYHEWKHYKKVSFVNFNGLANNEQNIFMQLIDSNKIDAHVSSQCSDINNVKSKMKCWYEQ